MIRTATQDDRFSMVRMGRDLNISLALNLPFDPAYSEASVKAFIADDDKLALVVDLGRIAGMLCAYTTLSPVAPVKVSFEQIMWVDPDHRGRWGPRLIRRYTSWSCDQGCYAAGLTRQAGGGLGPLYQRLGFLPGDITDYMVF